MAAGDVELNMSNNVAQEKHAIFMETNFLKPLLYRSKLRRVAAGVGWDASQHCKLDASLLGHDPAYGTQHEKSHMVQVRFVLFAAMPAKPNSDNKTNDDGSGTEELAKTIPRTVPNPVGPTDVAAPVEVLIV